MSTSHRWVVCVLFALTAGGCGRTQEAVVQAQAVDENGAPVFRVDPFWPKRLPNKWSMQQVVDLYVDVDDHVWIINRSVDARPDRAGRPMRFMSYFDWPAVPETATSAFFGEYHGGL